MKKSIFLTALLLVFALGFSQQLKFPKKIKTSSVDIPGTTFMLDQCETTVGDWLCFLYQRYYDPTNNRLKEGVDHLLPDYAMLPEKYQFMIEYFLRLREPTAKKLEKMIELIDETSPYPYLYPFYGTNCMEDFFLPLFYKEGDGDEGERLTRFLRLPMVGVSYDQVQEYLRWREELTKSDKAILKTGYKVKVRLITKDEWNELAKKAGPRMPGNTTVLFDSMNTEGCYLVNVMALEPCSNILEGRKLYGEGSFPVLSYYPDQFGLYDLFGNVAEMTEENGVSAGGSFAEFASECGVGKVKGYTGPEQWLGFRCLLEFSK
jgi:formylglycine-generating enzyme required for sulfatase activity